ncbi:DNA topoisomerase IB [Microbacterium koreense]|uniref:DNA topoisomerase n=1 Tax=Microbacterium koreense TaxID=323761 RepID=A0ABW2ZNX9_9MICO
MALSVRRVHPDETPGYRRVRAGRGFRYETDTGHSVSDEERARIAALVIPPAWRDVWICADAAGHVQALGTDAAGRRQYLYHPGWRARRDRGKFTRALELAATLPHARRRVTITLRECGDERSHVLAAAFRLLDTGAPRIGSARYLERHGSRGLTTLQRRHATIAGTVVTLSFTGKARKRALIEIDDEDLAAAVRNLIDGRATGTLLAYRDGRRRVPLTPRDVNDHVRELTAGMYTAKDFRTLHGTIVAATTLAQLGPVSSKKDRRDAERFAVRATATALGNTEAVARSSYIDPRVFSRYRRGDVMDLSRAPESAVRALLTGRER